jgi:hypothetical protein
VGVQQLNKLIWHFDTVHKNRPKLLTYNLVLVLSCFSSYYAVEDQK